jgi:hypothetical protein
MPTICTLGANAPIREFAIVPPVLAIVLPATTVWLANVLCALTTAMIVVPAGPRNYWLLKLGVLIPNLGMP